jgi:hypothetical protein
LSLGTVSTIVSSPVPGVTEKTETPSVIGFRCIHQPPGAPRDRCRYRQARASPSAGRRLAGGAALLLLAGGDRLAGGKKGHAGEPRRSHAKGSLFPVVPSWFLCLAHLSLLDTD